MKIKDILLESNDFLANLVAIDQQERLNYDQFVHSKAQGNYELGAKMYAELMNRSPDDIFGERARLKGFTKTKFNFDLFDQQDWENYWLLSQHCDFDRSFQRKALNIISMNLGHDHEYVKFLYDRIICGITGRQKYNTQDICQKD